jgi:hypothetical protein
MIPKDPALLAPMTPRSAPAPVPRRHRPHTLSRRRFLGGAAAALGATAVLPGSAMARTRTDATPQPIPGGFTIDGVTFHVNGFGLDMEPSTITDFNGFVGICDVRGAGTSTNPDGSTETLLFDTDMRFMVGEYVGADRRMHHGTFGFV